MIIFDRLWETMQKKNVTQYKLITNYGCFTRAADD